MAKGMDSKKAAKKNRQRLRMKTRGQEDQKSEAGLFGH